MGSFTTIRDVKTGESVQIKCGYDDCEAYQLGDEVNWWHDPKRPGRGKLGDDVYLGLGGDKDEWLDMWVIIKHHKVHEIRRRISLDAKADRDYANELQALRKEFDVWGWAHNLWPDELWAVYYEEKAAREVAYARLREEIAAAKHGTAQETLAGHLADGGASWMRERMKEKSFMSQILPATELPDGA